MIWVPLVDVFVTICFYVKGLLALCPTLLFSQPGLGTSMADDMPDANYEDIFRNVIVNMNVPEMSMLKMYPRQCPSCWSWPSLPRKRSRDIHTRTHTDHSNLRRSYSHHRTRNKGTKLKQRLAAEKGLCVFTEANLCAYVQPHKQQTSSNYTFIHTVQTPQYRANQTLKKVWVDCTNRLQGKQEGNAQKQWHCGLQEYSVSCVSSRCYQFLCHTFM